MPRQPAKDLRTRIDEADSKARHYLRQASQACVDGNPARADRMYAKAWKFLKLHKILTGEVLPVDSTTPPLSH